MIYFPTCDECSNYQAKWQANVEHRLFNIFAILLVVIIFAIIAIFTKSHIHFYLIFSVKALVCVLPEVSTATALFCNDFINLIPRRLCKLIVVSHVVFWLWAANVFYLISLYHKCMLFFSETQRQIMFVLYSTSRLPISLHYGNSYSYWDTIFPPQISNLFVLPPGRHLNTIFSTFPGIYCRILRQPRQGIRLSSVFVGFNNTLVSIC